MAGIDNGSQSLGSPVACLEQVDESMKGNILVTSGNKTPCNNTCLGREGRDCENAHELSVGFLNVVMDE